MLQVFSRGSNNIVIWLDSTMLILISYETPIAFVIKRRDIAYINEKKLSQTTVKHINKFFRDIGVNKAIARTVGNSEFESELERYMQIVVSGDGMMRLVSDPSRRHL